MDFDQKAIVESILKTEELAQAEKTAELRLRRIATWDTPTIEYAYQNTESMNTIAFIFPDLAEDVDEWVKWGLDMLSHYDSCIACFPAEALSDANRYCDCLADKGLESLQIGVVAYDKNGNIMVIRMYVLADTSSKKRSKWERKSYWCWWRDASHYEVATLLELSEKYDDLDEDIYTKKVYPEFYDMMINQQTKQWDGTPRNKNYSVASFKAEKQNYKIPMCQLGLWEASTGHITPKGRALLEVVRNNGDSSRRYLAYLSKLLLLDGKHLDLIKDLDDFQKSCPEVIPESSAEYFILFDNYMETKGSIGTRKPSAVKTGAKKAYVRDEPKLWNKLGFIIPSGKGRYYWPFTGIKFNWPKINEILISTEDSQGDIL